jgi:hypothetical protein
MKIYFSFREYDEMFITVISMFLKGWNIDVHDKLHNISQN